MAKTKKNTIRTNIWIKQQLKNSFVDECELNFTCERLSAEDHKTVTKYMLKIRDILLKYEQD